MPKVYIQKLEDAANASVDRVGGKAANLAQAMAQDFPVPPGFIITTAAYSDQLTRLFPTNKPASDGSLIREMLISSTLSEDLEKEIIAHHHLQQAQKTEPLIYAVRSSATAEDMAHASFAGQHESYYYVSEDNLVQMVKNCWASLWSEAACTYRNSQGFDHLSVEMAVIVQEMVKSDVSGITFTADPVSGDEAVVVIESSWGMGAAIVDGRVTPDQYTVDRATRSIVKSRISDKRYMVPPAPDDPEHIRIIDVPESQRLAESLSEEQVQLVTYYALKAEQHFGCSQDIEWAFRDESFYLLQSRPVTRSGVIEEAIPEGQFVLFKPLVENFTEPLLPLSQEILTASGCPVTFVYGRAYSNLAHIRLLIPFKLTDYQLSQVAYLSGEGIGKLSISFRKIPGLMLLLALYYLTMGVLYARTKNMPDDFMNSFRGLADSIDKNESFNALQALNKLFSRPRFFEPVGNMVLLVNISASRYWILMSVIKFLFNKWLPHLRKEAPSIFTSGSEGIMSTQMGRDIVNLAALVRENITIRDIMLGAQASELMGKLEAEPQAKLFLEALNKFLAIHGHRAIKEMEPGSPRWEENPTTIINMIKNYLHDQYSLLNGNRNEQKSRDNRERLLADIKSGLEKKPLERVTRFRWRLISFLGNRAKYFIKLRENSRFFHIMIFHVIRKKILRKESQFLRGGQLKCRDDIFYLELKEIEALDSGQMGYADIEDLIRQRRLNHIRLSKFSAPKTLGIELPFVEPSNQHSENKILKGQATSPGVYEGKARVILDPAVNAELKHGEILIAPYTDPAWTPLFLTASAAVVETGSYLSHAGTIAREYGMPCVVDVPNCTSLIRSGDLVAIDGTLGTVSWRPKDD